MTVQAGNGRRVIQDKQGSVCQVWVTAGHLESEKAEEEEEGGGRGERRRRRERWLLAYA